MRLRAVSTSTTVAEGYGPYQPPSPSETVPASPPPPTHAYLTSESPGDRPWDRHRRSAEKVAEHFESSPDEILRGWASRMRQCSKYLTFVRVLGDDGGSRYKLKHANFCRVRFCPTCQWRRTLAWTARMLQALPVIQADYPGHRWLLLTLTVRNVAVEDVRKSVGSMAKSFVRMTQRKAWPAVGLSLIHI